MTEKSEKYKLKVYNTLTHKIEEIEVSEEIYTTYCRTGWNIQDNDESFFAHEIQMSGLIGGKDDAFENFQEFIDTENLPDKTVIAEMELDNLHRAIASLANKDKALIKALFYDGLTEREYADLLGVYRNAIHKRKIRILSKIKKILES